MSAGGAHAER